MTGASVRARVDALMGVGRPERAWDVLVAAIGDDPDDPDLRSLAAWVLLALGDVDEAAEQAERAIGLDPEHHASTYRHLAEATARLGRADDAFAAISTALRLDPDDPWCHFMFARLLSWRRRGDDTDREREALDQAVRLAPEDPDLLAAVAGAWMDYPDLRKARRIVDRGLTVDPTHLGLLARKGELSHGEDAATVLTGVLAEAPHHEQARFALARKVGGLAGDVGAGVLTLAVVLLYAGGWLWAPGRGVANVIVQVTVVLATLIWWAYCSHHVRGSLRGDELRASVSSTGRAGRAGIGLGGWSAALLPIPAILGVFAASGDSGTRAAIVVGVTAVVATLAVVGQVLGRVGTIRLIARQGLFEAEDGARRVRDVRWDVGVKAFLITLVAVLGGSLTALGRDALAVPGAMGAVLLVLAAWMAPQIVVLLMTARRVRTFLRHGGWVAVVGWSCAAGILAAWGITLLR